MTAPQPNTESGEPLPTEGEQPRLEVVPDPPLDEPSEPATDDAAPANVESKHEPQASAGLKDRVDALADRAAEVFTPPDLWNEDRPSLSKAWRFARYSGQIPATGPARWGALGFFFAVSMPATTAAYTYEFIHERPARVAVFSVLITLAALWEPTRLALTVLLWPLNFGLDLITDY